MEISTRLLDTSNQGIDYAAKLLTQGEVVAIPTETVYGLAANALDENAVKKIFEAKGRPADNPLIVHIAEFEDIYKYAKIVPENAVKLANMFWCGPMTMVLPKADIIPSITSGGLDTVGIRMPSNPIARSIIKKCGFPLAAPSANLSGSPSPTNADHVARDMVNRIPAIVDGGDCSVGLESTVVSVDEYGKVCLLRPGYVTLDNLKKAVGEDNVTIAKGVMEELDSSEKALSPGMKYKHYSPKADVVIIKGEYSAFVDYVKQNCDNNTAVVIFGEEECVLPCRHFNLGMTAEEQATRLFAILRMADDIGIEKLYFRAPCTDGVGLAVYNRLLRAAGFEVTTLD